MNTGVIITLAYPETIVSHADEWYSKYLYYLGVGSRKYVRAGHAALVLINKNSGILEYHDFGRYITSEPNGRVRGHETDHELEFPLKACFKNEQITNLDDILMYLATHPKKTHGEGTLYASVCNDVNYKLAREHINQMQEKGLIRYAAFVKNACNCARFVTDSLIASTTNETIREQLIKSNRFTPSTIGNVVLADTNKSIFKVTDKGEIGWFDSSVFNLNWKLFRDRLHNYQPSTVGTILPKENDFKASHAQWLGGIAAGAWFELYKSNMPHVYRFRRISPSGNIDCDALYAVNDSNFTYDQPYKFVHYSNCKFFHIEQDGSIYRFEIKNQEVVKD